MHPHTHTHTHTRAHLWVCWCGVIVMHGSVVCCGIRLRRGYQCFGVLGSKVYVYNYCLLLCYSGVCMRFVGEEERDVGLCRDWRQHVEDRFDLIEV